jgi:hypothetical protein
MSNPYEPPPQVPPPFSPGPGAGTPDATGGLIPYNNGPALIAYYLSIFTLLCCVTPVPLGFVATVFGIMGLRKRAREPAVKGSVHAWIGIVLGTLSGLCSLLAAVVWFGGMIAAAKG